MRVPKRSKPAGRVIRAKRRVVAAVTVLVAVAALAGARRVFLAGERPPTRPGPTRALPVAVTPAPRPTREVTFAEGCSTAECHGPMGAASAVHAPVAHGACDTCHAPDSGGHVYPLRGPRTSLCTACHGTRTDGSVRHKAMADDGCLGCHDPHGSENGLLLTAGTVEETCAGCHPRTEGSVPHAPYAAGECHACHEAHASDTPALLRRGTIRENCGACHQALSQTMDASPHSHAGVEGSCLACHAAHASGVGGLLKGPGRDVCVKCHQSVAVTVAGARVSHDAVLAGRQCLSCHDPHGSDNPGMLRADEASVCLGCHDRALRAADGREIPAMASVHEAPVVHGPVRAGQCAACHSVHGANHSRLLRQISPNALPGGFDERNYALCFACHDRDLVLAESGDVTFFRDGATNLHRVHAISGGQARGCGNCHTVHAGGLPRLIAETVAYEGSDWKMPIGFTLTETGGSCAPGCHEPLDYRRDPPSSKEGGAP